MKTVNHAIRSLELFTGAGGLALGTHRAGFRHVALVEWNGEACNTLRTNATAEAEPGISDWEVLQDDARHVDFRRFGPIDLIAGGPPCQPFSIGGKHRGMADERDMFPQFIRAIRELAPRAFIIENVRGLLRPAFRNYFSHVYFQLAYPTVERRKGESWSGHLPRLEDIHTSGHLPNLHYNVVFRLLNAADYGVPQTRERVFIVGFRADTGIEWHFPEPTHSLDGLLRDQWVTGTYWERHKIKPPDSPPQWIGLRPLRWPPPIPTAANPWCTVRDSIADLPPPSEDRDAPGVLNHRLQLGARPYVGHTGSPMDLPAKTLKAGDHGVPGGENMLRHLDNSVRYFTVREAARIQTFPDAWRIEGPWSEAMRQIGNAVPVELAHIVAESVARALRGHRD